MAGGWVAFDQDAAEAGIALGSFKAPGKASEKALENLFFLYADDAVVRTAHPDIGLVSGALRQHSIIGGGNVSVCAQDGGDAPIEIPAKSNLF